MVTLYTIMYSQIPEIFQDFFKIYQRPLGQNQSVWQVLTMINMWAYHMPSLFPVVIGPQLFGNLPEIRETMRLFCPQNPKPSKSEEWPPPSSGGEAGVPDLPSVAHDGEEL